MAESTADVRILPPPEGQDVLTEPLRDGARRLFSETTLMRTSLCNDSPLFRRDLRRAGQHHRLSSRRKSRPLDETGRRNPVGGVPWKAESLSRTALGELYPGHQFGLKLEGGNLMQRPSVELKDHGRV